MKMSGSSLSDRLKSVEDEINEITSLMSLEEKVSKLSNSGSNSDTCTISQKSSSKSLSLTSSHPSLLRSSHRLSINSDGSKSSGESCFGAGNGKKKRNIRSQLPSSLGETRLKGGYLSSSSLDSSTASVNSTGDTAGGCRASVAPLKIPPSSVGDNKNEMMQSYDSLQSFLCNINTSIVKGNEAVMSKIAIGKSYGLDLIDCNKSASAPGSSYGPIGNQVTKYQELVKELDDEREKRLKNERVLEEMKVELNNSKEDAKNSKELYLKYQELSQQMEKKNKRLMEQLKLLEKTSEEKGMEVELSKQKYDSIVKDLKMEQERIWAQERDFQQMKDCLDQSHLKIQELLGARKMAVELAHDLQKKHQVYVVEHQSELQELKSKNVELEKLLNESVHEKNCLVERVQSLEDLSIKYKRLQNEVKDYKKSLAEAEKTISEFTRNPQEIPCVKNILSSQEQTFKAALTEKATSEMALQAKYTTLEVELQIIQDEYCKKLAELEIEKDNLVKEAKLNSVQLLDEISRLKLVNEELTELSNQYKARITELSDINKHQEVLIKCQNEAISSKEERAKLSNQEAELNIHRIEQEKKNIQLEHEKAVTNLNKLLEEERDKLRVKEKIADDQTETIMQLKQNLADRVREVQKKTKEVHRLDQMLKQERLEKENLNSDVQHLKMHRARLNETINELQTQIDSSKNNDVHKKHKQLLDELEMQVSQKQVNLESEISKLQTERDQARETAQYAIENLTSAMEEYHKELTNQKTLQTKLAGLIREKEEQLNVAESKVKDLLKEKKMFDSLFIVDKCRFHTPYETKMRAPMTHWLSQLNMFSSNMRPNVTLERLMITSHQ